MVWKVQQCCKLSASSICQHEMSQHLIYDVIYMDWNVVLNNKSTAETDGTITSDGRVSHVITISMMQLDHHLVTQLCRKIYSKPWIIAILKDFSISPAYGSAATEFTSTNYIVMTSLLLQLIASSNHRKPRGFLPVGITLSFLLVVQTSSVTLFFHLMRKIER